MKSAHALRGIPTSTLRAVCQKGTGELFLVSRYVYRPFTIYVTRLYAILGISALGATMHSAIAALVAAGVLLLPSPLTFIVAAVGLQVYFVLDHVDGELARLDDWRGVRPLSLEGEYADFLVHFHSLNLVFATLGVGMGIATGSVFWAAVGIVADNALGNFPRFTLARTVASILYRDSSIVRHPMFWQTVAACTEANSKQLFSEKLSPRRKAFLLTREAFGYPGCLVVLSVTLTIDAVSGLNLGAFSATWSLSYLLVFASVGVLGKARSTWLVRGQLRDLSRAMRGEAVDDNEPSGART